MKNLNLVLKGASITFIGLVAARLLSYIYVLLVSRLGTEQYGMLSIAVALTSFVSTLAILGMQTGIVRYASYYLGKKDLKSVKGSILSALKLSVPTSIILSLLLLIFSEKIAVLFFHNTKIASLLKVLAVMIPFSALNENLISVFISFKRIGYVVIVKEIIDRIIKFSITALLIYLGFGLIGATYALSVTAIVISVILFYLLNKKVFRIFDKRTEAKFYTKEMFFFSMPLVFNAVLFLLVKWADVITIGIIKGAEQTGIYNVALPTASLLVVVPTALMSLFTPIMHSLYGQGKIKEIKKLSKRTTKWIFLFNFPLFILLFLFSKEIILVVFGKDYLPGALSLSVLSLGFIIFSISHIPTNVLIMIKKTNLHFKIGAFTTFVNIGLNIILIPRIGIVGGAVSTSIALTLMYIIYSYYAYKFLKLQILSKKLFNAFISSMPSLLVIYLIKGFFKTSFLSIALEFSLFMIVYLIILLSLKSFDKEDMELFNKIKMKLKSYISAEE